MANHYYQATVSPELPSALFTEEELDGLEVACGLTCERDDQLLYFFADTSFSEEGQYDRDGEDVAINCLTLLQEKLRELDPAAYPYISIQEAATCSKILAGEFGGLAHFILRDQIRSMSTWQWLHEQEQSLKPASDISA
jgi:hypothetical protein